MSFLPTVSNCSSKHWPPVTISAIFIAAAAALIVYVLSIALQRPPVEIWRPTHVVHFNDRSSTMLTTAARIFKQCDVWIMPQRSRGHSLSLCCRENRQNFEWLPWSRSVQLTIQIHRPLTEVLTAEYRISYRHGLVEFREANSIICSCHSRWISHGRQYCSNRQQGHRQIVEQSARWPDLSENFRPCHDGPEIKTHRSPVSEMIQQCAFICPCRGQSDTGCKFDWSIDWLIELTWRSHPAAWHWSPETMDRKICKICVDLICLLYLEYVNDVIVKDDRLKSRLRFVVVNPVRRGVIPPGSHPDRSVSRDADVNAVRTAARISYCCISGVKTTPVAGTCAREHTRGYTSLRALCNVAVESTCLCRRKTLQRKHIVDLGSRWTSVLLRQRGHLLVSAVGTVFPFFFFFFSFFSIP